MSFDQLDINRNEQEKKKAQQEKEKTLAFLEEKKLLRESANLLYKLANEISGEFWISLEKAKEIISRKSNASLEDLKSELSSSWENMNYEKLLDAINTAKSQIEDISKKLRENLKKSLDEDSISPDSYQRPLTERFISEKIRKRVIYPENFTDQILWVPVGLIDSTEAVILFVYSLWRWVLLTPYHIYLYLTWKAEFPYKNL